MNHRCRKNLSTQIRSDTVKANQREARRKLFRRNSEYGLVNASSEALSEIFSAENSQSTTVMECKRVDSCVKIFRIPTSLVYVKLHNYSRNSGHGDERSCLVPSFAGVHYLFRVAIEQLLRGQHDCDEPRKNFGMCPVLLAELPANSVGVVFSRSTMSIRRKKRLARHESMKILLHKINVKGLQNRLQVVIKLVINAMRAQSNVERQGNKLQKHFSITRSSSLPCLWSRMCPWFW